jgi:hypothetical protein
VNREFGQGPHRFIGAVFGFVFAAIGLTVIVFLWSSDPDDFHSPPLFFKIFGSLIAVVFVLVGGTVGVASLRHKPVVLPGPTGAETVAAAPAAAGGYKCPHCAAPLGEKADVSPSGDAKCSFCGRWFNIHRGV